MVVKKVSRIITFWVFTLLSVNALAQDETVVPQKLMVGTMVAPPFAMKTADGSWEGLSIELVKMIAQDLGAEYELVLKYLVRTEFPGRVHVLPEIFDHYSVGMAMPQGSPLREPVNRALLKIIDTDDWLRLKERYIGSGR